MNKNFSKNTVGYLTIFNALNLKLFQKILKRDFRVFQSNIQQFFICHPSDSTVSAKAGIWTNYTLRYLNWQPDSLTSGLDLIHLSKDIFELVYHTNWARKFLIQMYFYQCSYKRIVARDGTGTFFYIMHSSSPGLKPELVLNFSESPLILKI